MRNFFSALAMVAALGNSAVAETATKVLSDPAIQYAFSKNKLKNQQFCDFTISISEVPLLIKLTAAFIINDRKPKEKVGVAYIVEGFVLQSYTGKPADDIQQVKVTSGRIVSDVFHTDFHAVKGKDSTLGASYLITTEGSLALFVSALTRGNFDLVVDFEDRPSILVHLQSSHESFDPSQKWMQCSVDKMK